MKKLILILLSILGASSFSFALNSSQNCIDLKSNLIKGNENANVLSLQEFLYDKGYLKVLPNGYFGNGTFLATKAYQKTLGYTQSGKVLTMTREAIRKETCKNMSVTSTISKGNETKPKETIFCTQDMVLCPNGTYASRDSENNCQPRCASVSNNILNKDANGNILCKTDLIRCSDGSYVGRSGPKCDFISCSGSSVIKNTTVTVQTSSTTNSYPLPFIISMDRTSFLENAFTDKGFTLTGYNFGTSTNDIYVINKSDGAKYFVGSFKKTTDTTIYASSSLSSDYFSCGTNCSRRLSPGIYDLYIDRNGSYNNIVSFAIKNFKVIPTSGTENQAIFGLATSTKIGNVQFGGAVPFSFDSLGVDLREDTISGMTTVRKTDFTNFVFKDPVTGQKIPTSAISMYEWQMKSVDIYADVNTHQNSGSIYATFKFNVVDSLFKGKSTIYSPEVLLTVSGY